MIVDSTTSKKSGPGTSMFSRAGQDTISQHHVFALPVHDIKELEQISKDQEKQLRSKIEKKTGRPDSSHGGVAADGSTNKKKTTKIIVEETHVVNNSNSNGINDSGTK